MSDDPSNEGQGSDLHIDADWKERAQQEKEELQQKLEQQQAEGGEAQGDQVPPADFKTLISTMASQALLYMGAIPEPSSGQRMVHLDLARHHIDMLGVIEDKTEGNLEDEEHQLLSQTLHELRNHYMNVQQQMAQHQAQQAQSGAEQGGQQSGGGPSIIDPTQG
jgi:hypothetical protein